MKNIAFLRTAVDFAFSCILLIALGSTSFVHAAPLKIQTPQPTLKVFWWNVRYYSIDQKLIQNLIKEKSQTHDVLFLGESRAKDFEILHQQNPHMYAYSSYYSRDRTGTEDYQIGVLSRYPLVIKQSVALDWGTDEQKRQWVAEHGKILPNYPIRNLNVYELKKDGQVFLLSPIHVFNPWPTLMKEKEGEVLASYSVASEVIFSFRDPLFYQVQNILRFITNWGLHTSPLPYMIIGDFNSPTRPVRGAAVNLITHYLKLLSQDPHIVWFSKDRNYTYPTALATELGEADTTHQVKIDHAFGNRNVKVLGYQILHEEGSDHYPIEIEISAQQ